ncbi:MAG: acetolactate synthase [Clostridia bacterium]|nr:acetolactate synthase [Clostridia bacterium]
MIIRQLSVFVENRQGRLAEVMDTLSENSIDISALSLADTADYGVLRLIVSDPEKGREVLTASGVVVRITEMVAAVLEDVPGGAARIVRLLAENGIAVEYMYACIGRVNGKALMVLRVEDIEKTETILSENGLSALSPEDIYRI